MLVFVSVFLIESNFRITKINNFEEIICPTITMPVSKNAVYNDIIGK